jgi:uncharacterized protein YvpB
MKILDVPFISQWDSVASYQNSDCFPVSACMLLAYYGIDIKPDDISRKIGVTGNTNFSQVANALKTFGHDLLSKSNQTLDNLKKSINDGIPFSATVNYSMLPNRQDTYGGAHLLVVVGYDDKDIYTNDPNFWGNRRLEGKNKKYPIKDFLRAWNDRSQGNNSGNYIYFDLQKKTLVDIDADIEGEIEDKYKLKSYKWYNKHWTFDQFIKESIKAFESNRNLESELSKIRNEYLAKLTECEKKLLECQVSKPVSDLDKYTLAELIQIIISKIMKG